MHGPKSPSWSRIPAPLERTQRLAPHGHRVPRDLDRASPTSAGGSTAGPGAGLAWTGSACAGFLATLQRQGLGQRSIGARALGAADASTAFSSCTTRSRGEPGQGRAARPSSDKRCPPTSTARRSTCCSRPRSPSRGRRLHQAPRSRDARAVLLDGRAAVRARRARPEPDVDLLSDQVKVRGKGRKERIVPMGGPAVPALRRYLLAPRGVARGPAPTAAAIFLNRRGRRLAPRGVQRRCTSLFDALAGGRAAGPFAAAHLRDAPAGRGRRPARGAGAARARLAQHHADVYSYQRGATEAGVPAGPSPRGSGSVS